MTQATMDLPETEHEQGPMLPVELHTRRDYSLVTTALEHRADSLEKLQKKNDDEGYPSLGRKVDADAKAIRELILPLFRAQQELPLASLKDLEAALLQTLRPLFTNQPHAGDKKYIAQQEGRDQDILATLSGRVARIVRQAAARGYWAGQDARDHEPSVVGLRAITDARLEEEKESEAKRS